MTPIEPGSEPKEAASNASSSVTPNVLDIVEALQRSLRPGFDPARDFHANTAEAESILQRLDRELAVEEALTRQLMARHGI